MLSTIVIRTSSIFARVAANAAADASPDGRKSSAAARRRFPNPARSSALSRTSTSATPPYARSNMFDSVSSQEAQSLALGPPASGIETTTPKTTRGTCAPGVFCLGRFDEVSAGLEGSLGKGVASYSG